MGFCNIEGCRGTLVLSLFTIMRRNPRLTGLLPGQVAVTFDDGPNLKDNVTSDLLDVLHQHSVRAGFCVVGQQVLRHPDVVRRMSYSGHLLINHTQSHDHPIRQNVATLLEEIAACDQEIGAALGVDDYRSDYFRAPFGIVTVAVRRAVRQLGLKHVLLSHYGWDTRVGPHNFAGVVDLLITNAKRHRGGMFVFHDGSLCPPKIQEENWDRSTENRSWVPEAIDRVICELEKHGLQFVLPGTHHTARSSRWAAAA
jgi:peptidoglycan/xylan/chitin deacetylase (PgdA/CDA1 family)